LRNFARGPRTLAGGNAGGNLWVCAVVDLVFVPTKFFGKLGGCLCSLALVQISQKLAFATENNWNNGF